MKQRGDFKSTDNPKKKRKTSAVPPAISATNGVQLSPIQELVPPAPMMGYGDTIVASNPFDDAPPPPRSMGQISGNIPHMNMNCPPLQPGGPHHHAGSPHGSPGPMPMHMAPQMGNPHMGNPHMGNPHMGMAPHMNGPQPQMGGQHQQMCGPPMPMGVPNGPPMGGRRPRMAGPPQQMGPGRSGSPSMHGGGMGQMREPGPGGPNGRHHLPPGMQMGNQQQWNGPPRPMYHAGGQGGPPSNEPMNCGPVNRPNGMPMSHQMGQPNHMPMTNGLQMHGNMPMPQGMGPQGPPGGNNMPQGPMSTGQQQQWNTQNGPSKPPQGGKMCPPDQPMIFNAQNPNAPPICTCGGCHKEVHDTEQAIMCESGCNFWFHRACTGLSETAFHYMNQEVYAEWVCDKCLSTKQIPLVKFKP